MGIILETKEDVAFWKEIYTISIKENFTNPSLKADIALKDLWARIDERQSSEKSLVLGKKNAQSEMMSILDIDEDLLPLFEGEYNWMQCWSPAMVYDEFLERVKRRVVRGEYCGETESNILGEAYKYWYCVSKPTNIKGTEWEGLQIAVYAEISGDVTFRKMLERMYLRDEWKALSESEKMFMNNVIKNWYQENTFGR